MQRRYFTASVCCILLLLGAMALIPNQQAAAKDGEVNLYSYRQPFLIKPILAKFTEKTGIKVNVVYAKKGMLERIKAEGEAGPADAVLTADIGRLHDMVEAGVLQPIKSNTLRNNIPTNLRHPKGYWYGLTTRGRVLFVSKKRVKPGEIKTYEDLADPKFKGRICSRSGKHVYNISLFASMIAHHGKAKTEKWLKGLKANLARKPQGNDRAQSKAVYEGVCDIAISNTYYFAKMATNKKKKAQRKWANAVRVVFPNQDDRGAHVNISGAAVVKGANNKKNAIKLIEFLSGKFAQKLYADQNYEYPVKAGVSINPLIKSLGEFKADSINLDKIAKSRATASKLVNQVGFNNPAGS